MKQIETHQLLSRKSKAYWDEYSETLESVKFRLKSANKMRDNTSQVTTIEPMITIQMPSKKLIPRIPQKRVQSALNIGINKSKLRQNNSNIKGQFNYFVA